MKFQLAAVGEWRITESEVEILLGLLIGVAIGGTGVGGGTLTVPALIILMGYPSHVAVATALIFSAAVKVCASGVYLLRRQVNFKVLGYLLAGGLPGAIFGAYALERLHSKKCETLILAAVGMIIAVTAIINLAGRRTPRTRGQSRLSLVSLLTVPIGIESGFSSAGSGALGTVVLFSCTTLAPTVVVGTDLLFGLFISGTAGLIHALGGNCEWSALAKLIPAGVVGTWIGSRVAADLSTKALRQTVLITTTCTGVFLLVKGLFGA